jgi:hypothetical protein
MHHLAVIGFDALFVEGGQQQTALLAVALAARAEDVATLDAKCRRVGAVQRAGLERVHALTDPRQRLLNWEIGINPRRADVGDTVKLSVPVYNYSLVPVTSVNVAFYRGNPVAGGALIGDMVIASIEARGRRVAEVDWTIPANTGRVTPIHAVIRARATASVRRRWWRSRRAAARRPALSGTPAG